MAYRVGLGLACVALLLALAPEADAQVRGKSYDGHRRSRPTRHPRRAPRRAATPPAPAPTGPWTAARARFVLSAESLLGVAHYRQTATETSDFETREATVSGFSAHVFKGSELFDLFGQARIGLDGVIGPGATLGGSIGYATYEQSTGASDSTISGFVIVPRLGWMLGPSRYLGVWLRAGIGYARVKVADDSSSATQSAVDLVLDPMLVVTPLPHVGLTLGPSLNIGLGGSVRTSNREADAKSSSYGLSAGLALLF